MSEIIDETPAYSGQRTAGFTEKGSYDRCIWDSNGDSVQQTSDAVDLVEMCIRRFQQSGRSRLVARMDIEQGVDVPAVRRHVQAFAGEVAMWPDNDEERWHLTLGLNVPERALPVSCMQEVQRTIREKISAVTPVSFEEHALLIAQSCRAQGMTFDEHPTAEDMFALWHQEFGWSQEQCRRYADERSDGNRVFVLRDRERRAISGVLIADGESTEWATLPAHQRQGHIIPLLLYANCAMMRDGMPSVYAELRWNRSVSPALKSGFAIDTDGEGSWLLTNHVTIGDGSLVDPPDRWNEHLPVFGDGTNGRMLRSFVIAHVEPEKFTQKILDAYLDS